MTRYKYNKRTYYKLLHVVILRIERIDFIIAVKNFITLKNISHWVSEELIPSSLQKYLNQINNYVRM